MARHAKQNRDEKDTHEGEKRQAAWRQEHIQDRTGEHPVDQ
jgi:hypothetical protein